MTQDSFETTLRRAIAARDLPLRRLVARLAAAGHVVTPATLSNWQRGVSVPTRPTSEPLLGELDVILGLEPGTLWSLARVGGRRAGRSVDDTRNADQRSAFEELGLAAQGTLSRVSVHGQVTFEDSVHRPRVEVTTVWRCDSGVARAGWADVTMPSGSPGTVRGVAMCRPTGRAVQVSEHRAITRLDFARPLLAGELLQTVCVLEGLGADEPWREVRIQPQPRHESASLIVDFRDRLPQAIDFVVESGADGHVLESRPVLPYLGKVQTMRSGHSSFVFGFRWTW